MKPKRNLAISETGFIFNPETGESYTTNPIGFEVISLLREGKNLDDIKQTLMEVYDVDEDTFKKDYFDFIKMLEHHQLVETHE